MEKQRAILAMFEILDFSDVERVIAGRMGGSDAGNEVSNRTLNNGHTGTIDKRNLEILLRPARKVRAQRLLMFRKNTHAKPACDGQNPVHVAAVVQRDQYQRGC